VSISVCWWRTPGAGRGYPGPLVAPVEDKGPARDRQRGFPWWKVYLPGLGVFRYRLDHPSTGISRHTTPLVSIQRGDAWAGWVDEDGEAARMGILRAHGISGEG
jgi:hypothetical protein